jgi:hypothetical protein
MAPTSTAAEAVRQRQAWPKWPCSAAPHSSGGITHHAWLPCSRHFAVLADMTHNSAYQAALRCDICRNYLDAVGSCCCSKIAEAEAAVCANKKKWLGLHMHVQLKLDELRGPPNPWLTVTVTVM